MNESEHLMSERFQIPREFPSVIQDDEDNSKRLGSIKMSAFKSRIANVMWGLVTTTVILAFTHKRQVSGQNHFRPVRPVNYYGLSASLPISGRTNPHPHAHQTHAALFSLGNPMNQFVTTNSNQQQRNSNFNLNPFQQLRLQRPNGHWRHTNDQQHRPVSERRASSSSYNQQPPATTFGAGSNHKQQTQALSDQQVPTRTPPNQQQDKLLICYYTTKQTAPYWPRDAREFVVPADQLDQVAANFVRGQNHPRDPSRTYTSERAQRFSAPIGQNFISLEPNIMLPSAARMVVVAPKLDPFNQTLSMSSQPPPQLGHQSQKTVAGNEIALDKVDSFAQLFFLPNNNRHKTIASRQDNGATTTTSSFNTKALMSQTRLKSTPSQMDSIVSNNKNNNDNGDQQYNRVNGIVFVNQNKSNSRQQQQEHDLNNNRDGSGLMLPSDARTKSGHPQAPDVLNSSPQQNSTISTPVVHFPTSRNDNEANLNNIQDLNNRDRSQLIFASPTMSRAFVVGASVGNSTSAAVPSHSTAIALDQPGSDRNQQGPAVSSLSDSNNGGPPSSYYYYYNLPPSNNQQQQAAVHLGGTAASTTIGHIQPASFRPSIVSNQQQHELSGTTLANFNSGGSASQRGKSLQVAQGEGEQALAPASLASVYLIGGHQPRHYSSALLMSSTSLAPASGNDLIKLPSSFSTLLSPSSHQQATVVDDGLISSGGKTTPIASSASSSSSSAAALPTTSSQIAINNGGSSLPTSPAVASSTATTTTTIFATARPASSSTASIATASSQSNAASLMMNDKLLPQQQQSVFNRHHQHNKQTVGVGSNGGLSAALVSSPLSTMFDVFGAASQYLMRFKPSSLISPSSFAASFAGDHHSNQAWASGQHNSRLNSSSASSSSPLFQATAGSPLISLPFSSSSAGGTPSTLLLSSNSNSKGSLNSNDLSSSANGIGGFSTASGFLSRLSLSNKSNQRREDICGRTIQTPERRIIGGEGAKYGEFPYQVHIKIAKHQCGGALIDKQSIVTAAHCVYHFITRAPVSKLQIVIGAYDIEDEQYQELPPQYFKVNKVKLHPNFRFSASHPDRYDIAILKLDKPVKYTDNVLPVCLPSHDLKYENMVGTVTGFGKTDPSLSNRYGTRLLQKVDVPIIENSECERWHRTRGIDLKIFPEMMCAGYEDGLKDACVGDSGGPLVVKTPVGSNGSFRWTLAGITSAGFGCAQSRQPGIYHRVSHTVDWILENLD